MTAEPTQDLLQRLSLQDLERAAHEALNAEHFSRAYLLLREAAQRAPFRQDFRELLAIALEGKLQPRADMPQPAASSPLRAMRAAAAPEDAVEGAAATVRPHPQSTLLRPSRFKSESTPATPVRRFKPGQYERRHRRGPMSALLLGGAAGVMLVTAVAGAGWIYLQRHGRNGADPGGGGYERARQEVAFEQANRYLQLKNYSLAIEQLDSLPPTPARDRRLADIYMEIGDQGFKREPPRLEAALEAYSKAVQYAPNNPENGLALAQVYYALARGNDDPGTRTRQMDLARQTLQAVIDRSPQHLPAYELLVRVAIAQKDYTLQQQTLQRIIDNWPKDSEAARNARDNLRSLGFKYEM